MTDESLTAMLRLFDASSQAQSLPSLNDCLHKEERCKGPTWLDELRSAWSRESEEISKPGQAFKPMYDLPSIHL